MAEDHEHPTHGHYPKGKHDGSKSPFKKRLAERRKKAKAAKKSRQRNR